VGLLGIATEPPKVEAPSATALPPLASKVTLSAILMITLADGPDASPSLITKLTVRLAVLGAPEELV